MSNVITGTIATFGGDDLWQENKVDFQPGYTVADLPNRALALYANEIDKQFKFINQYFNGVVWAVSGTSTTLSASQMHLAGADHGDGSSLANDLVIGDGVTSSDRGMTIFTPSANDGYIFFADPGSDTAGGFSYDHGGDLFRFRAGNLDRAFIDSTSFSPNTNGLLSLGTVTRNWTDLYVQLTGTISHLSSSTATIVTGTIYHVTASTMSIGGAPRDAGAINANDLSIGDVGRTEAGLSVITSPAASIGRMSFVDSNSAVARGGMQYQHNGDRMNFIAGGVATIEMTSTRISPLTDLASDLGTESLRWGELHVMTGAFHGPTSGTYTSFHGYYAAGNQDEVFIPWTGGTESAGLTLNGNQFAYWTPANGVVDRISFRGGAGDITIGIWQEDNLTGTPSNVVGHLTHSSAGSGAEVIQLDGSPFLTGSTNFEAGKGLAISLSGSSGAGYTIVLRHDWTT